MNKLQVSKAAQYDLLEIKAYIANDLEEHPLMGAPISSVSNANSEERFLVSGKYLVFYHVIGKEVFIDRVLYGGRDYLKILFEDALKEEND